MKKIIVCLCAVVCSLSVMATETAFVRVKLVGSDPVYSVSTLRLTEDDARTPAVESGYDVSCNMTQSNDNTTLIYGMIGGSEYSSVATNSLTGLYIGFKTNNVDDNYTLKFEAFSGNAFTIYDRWNGKTITVNGTTPDYGFTVEASQVGQQAINNRFVINYVPTPLKVCVKDDELIIEENPYVSKIVIKKGDTKIGEWAASTGSIALTPANGFSTSGTYTAVFADGEKKFFFTVPAK